ncbi:dienelactone hydrolase [Arthrobacter sp. Hiyo1]|nr:dienelactone hydrolase [Arthrobacter sp. Hiyo1]
MNDVPVGPRPLRPLMRVMGIKPDPAAAPEAWQRIEDHFAKYLKAEPTTTAGTPLRGGARRRRLVRAS